MHLAERGNVCITIAITKGLSSGLVIHQPTLRVVVGPEWGRKTGSSVSGDDVHPERERAPSLGRATEAFPT